MADDTSAPPAFADGAKIAARFAATTASIAAIEADLAIAIAPLKARADKKLTPLAKKRDELEAAAKAWWAVHADAVRGTKKSAELAGCVLGTRLSPAKVTFAHGADKIGVAILLKRRMLALLQRVIMLDKKAIAERLKEEAEKPEAERVLAQLGFGLQQDETFYIEPATRTGRKS